MPHGDVQTPVFMPVGTAGTVKGLTNADLESIGFKIILGNTYHLFLRPGPEIIAEAGGLHGFNGWSGNILTDSGGFQIFSLAGFRKITDEGAVFRSHIDGSTRRFTPENVVDSQCAFNSDIQMQLDVCSAPDTSYKKAASALSITESWMRRAYTQYLQRRNEGYEGLFFPIVQGNFFKDLREKSAAAVTELGTPGVAIGGLSVGESAELFDEYLHLTAAFIPKEKARYVMGIGTEDYILNAIECGIDMFDCVLPTRLARHGIIMTSCGNIQIKKECYARDFSPPDPSCACRVCAAHSKAYLRHLFRSAEILSAILLSYHNLYYLNNLVLNARRAICENRFAEYRRETLSALKV